MEIIKYLAIAGGVVAGLYVAWKLLMKLLYHQIRRDRRAHRELVGESYCVHTTDGSVFRYARRPNEVAKPLIVETQPRPEESPGSKSAGE